MAADDRTRWVALIEGHWDHFNRAGWVQRVSYRSYDPATDTVSATAIEKIDAVVKGESKQERPTPDGGRVIVITRRCHLRISQMGATRATKRGRIVLADGTEYLVESVEAAAENTRYACDTVRL